MQKKKDEKIGYINFRDEEDERKFLNDEKYFENSRNYCLGKTLEEAGEILRLIASQSNDKNSEFYVERAKKKTKKKTKKT